MISSTPALSICSPTFLDLTFDHAQTGAPVRTRVPALVLVLAAVGFFDFATVKKTAASGLWPLPWASLFLFAYLGGMLPVLKQTQPYRQIAPAILFATLPAAMALSWTARRRTWSGASRPVKVFAVAALILLAPRFARTVLYFFPRRSLTTPTDHRVLGEWRRHFQSP